MTSEQPPLEEFGEDDNDLVDEDWEEVIFSEVITINDYPSAEKGEEYRSVGMSDVDRDQRKIEDWEYKEYSYSRPRFRNSQTLMARITPCLENGKTAFVDILEDDEVAVGSTEFIVLSDTDRTLPKFVYYTARRPEIRQFAIKRMTGTSGRQRVPLDIFDSKKINLPPIEEQKKIVSILDAIDSKIEINNGVNEILEEMAQATFKSWFADFQPFDDFKTSKFGKIPESFTISNLTDITDIVLGGTPDSDEDSYWDGDIVWAKTKDVSNEEEAFISSTEESITKEGLEESSTEIAPKDSTIITARGTVGQLAMPAFDMAINQSSYSLVAERDTDDYFVYCLMNNILNNLTSRTHGTVFDTITKSTLNEQEIVLPPAEQREKFDQIVDPLMEKIKKNQKENKYLEELRDTLLPKLMSGEIRVNDIELDDLEVDSEV